MAITESTASTGGATSKPATTTTTCDLTKILYTKVPSKRPESAPLLAQIKRTEKHTFPTSEAFQFDSELVKRTTHLYCTYTHSPHLEPAYRLCGYVVFLRSKALTRIHKVCVVESLRGRGIGKMMLETVLEGLRRGGVTEVDLWVDQERAPARALYEAFAFEEKEVVENYYGEGRTGIRMSLGLIMNRT
ncbi:acyl-CoA N-acyltransferase [Kalaharituber pfeilii]|nr:acyl-CoA N-acyltransferase [Kalaharituber pfeilii]